MAFRIFVLVLALFFSGCFAWRADGWIVLLDGSDPSTLSNWARVGNANWRVEEGAVVADKGDGNNDLVSNRAFQNFELLVEFWAERTTNSAVHIRAQNPNDILDTNSYEVNIFDERPDPAYGTGAIVHVATVPGSYKAAGRWNTYRIMAIGSRLTVALNGELTAATEDWKFSGGRIALQYAPPGGAIKFRKVLVRPL